TVRIKILVQHGAGELLLAGSTTWRRLAGHPGIVGMRRGSFRCGLLAGHRATKLLGDSAHSFTEVDAITPHHEIEYSPMGMAAETVKVTVVKHGEAGRSVLVKGTTSLPMITLSLQLDLLRDQGAQKDRIRAYPPEFVICQDQMRGPFLFGGAH